MGRCKLSVGLSHHRALTQSYCRTTKEHFRLSSSVCNDKFPKKVRNYFGSQTLLLDTSIDNQVLRG